MQKVAIPAGKRAAGIAAVELHRPLERTEEIANAGGALIDHGRELVTERRVQLAVDEFGEGGEDSPAVPLDGCGGKVLPGVIILLLASYRIYGCSMGRLTLPLRETGLQVAH